MGGLVDSLIGGAIGFAFGGPAGAKLGFAAGSAVDAVNGGSVFAPEPPPRAPSLAMPTPAQPWLGPPDATGKAASDALLAPADPSNGTAQAGREAAAEAERRRVAGARGFESTNPTGGRGDLSTPNLAAKSLLGQ